MAQIGQRPFLSTHLADRLSLQIQHFTFSSLIGILPFQNLFNRPVKPVFFAAHLGYAQLQSERPHPLGSFLCLISPMEPVLLRVIDQNARPHQRVDYRLERTDKVVQVREAAYPIVSL